ncbi:S-layer homology domain-containing protein [Thiolapillus sp.]
MQTLPKTKLALGMFLALGNMPTMAANYGISDPSISVIPAISFEPLDTGTFFGTGPLGNRCVITDDTLMAALPDDIPDGALITEVDGYFYDNDATNDAYFIFGALYADKDTGAGFTLQGLETSSSTSGQPGNTVVKLPLSLVIDHTQDMNSDGKTDLLSYAVAVQLGNGSGDVCINQLAITWYRQVSPAPAAATFNDVPTSHQFFREIEALADSGITSGCGGGNYCPDSPLTRGQMAVFLSRALGLHWADN